MTFITKEEIKDMPLYAITEVAKNYNRSIAGMSVPTTQAQADGLETILATLRTYQTAILEAFYSSYSIRSEKRNDEMYNVLKSFSKSIETIFSLLDGYEN